MKRLHAFVRGHVQGVYFRQTTKEVATKMGVVGWVRNLDDGRVEVLAEAPRSTLDGLVEWLRVGSPGSRVDNVAVEWEAATGEFERFRVTS